MWKKVARFAGIFVLCAFAVIQLVPYGHQHTNPPVTYKPHWDSNTEALFRRACADCHSNESRWPWYSNIAPTSWLVQRDVDAARKHFNVSEDRVDFRDEATDMVADDKMPPPNYRLLHPEARLTPQERKALSDGLAKVFDGGVSDRPQVSAKN